MGQWKRCQGLGATVLMWFCPWDVFIDSALYPWCPGPCPHSTSPPSSHNHCHPPSGWWLDHTSRAKNMFHPPPLSPVGPARGWACAWCHLWVAQGCGCLSLIGITMMHSLDPGTKHPAIVMSNRNPWGVAPLLWVRTRIFGKWRLGFPKPDQGPTICF